MANSTVNKVILGTETLLDLTEDTATAADVLAGKTFHLASGAQGTGSLDMSVETFTGTAQSNISGNCQGVYIPALGLVILSFNFAVSSGSAGTSTNLFQIPADYRPSSTKYGSGYAKTSSSTGGIRTSVNSNGYVRQNSFSAATGGNGVIVYEVG